MSDFAERLNLLFATFLQPATAPGRRPEEWSNAAVARAAAELHAADTTAVLTRQYLGMLRSGERAHPSLRAANAIADAFAELASRAGHVCEPTELLTFLAGSYTTDPGGTQSPVLGRPAVVSEPAEGEGAAPAALARSGHDVGDDQSRAAVLALIDQLSRPEAEPMRRKLARLLGRSDQH